jgi:trigger factor
MKTDVRSLTPVDYALDIEVPAEDLQPQILDALKAQRSRLDLKGFRRGKVPMGVVRKMVGPQVAIEVAERTIGEAYRKAVAEPEELEVLGQPRLVELDFDADDKEAGLKATVQFGVRPEFELADLDGVPVTRVVRTFTDEDVEADLQRRRDLAATEDDAPEGTALEEDHVAIVDIQPVDAEGEPTAPKQEGARLVLANPDLRSEMKGALVGKTVGDEVTVELPHLHDDDEETDHDDHVDRYRVTVTEVKVRTVPEADADFVREQTDGETESLDDLKGQIRDELDRSWKARAQQALEQKMAEQFVLAHRDAVKVPETLTEAALDAMLEETTGQAGGQLPPTFDVEAWRDQNRQQAEDQVRWMLVKDRLVEEENLEVTNEDFDAEFEKLAGDDTPADFVRQYFSQQPKLLEQMGDQLLNRRVFGALEGRFTVVEKSREDIEKEMAERQAAQAEAPVALTPAAADGPADESPAGEDEA